MKHGKAASVEELQMAGRFEELQRTLHSPRFDDRLDSPLAYWALPSDRRLPLALLGRTLRDLLSTPFANLVATPGIGRKKIAALLFLLARAADSPPTPTALFVPAPASPPNPARCPAVSAPNPARDDPADISESTWAQWRATVVRQNLADEPLGRFVPSLRNMTRAIWNAPLGQYIHASLADIRSMKTHGEKRIRAILDAFRAVHLLAAGIGNLDHLVARIVPRRIDRVEQWVGRALQRSGVPEESEIFAELIHPLLEQIRADASPQITELAENRLGLRGPMSSVRQASRAMGLTRARVYQLLNEINDIMTVRWPLGRHQVHELRKKWLSEAAASHASGASERPGHSSPSTDLSRFLAAVELFYPGARRGADGSLEFASDASYLETELIEVF